MIELREVVERALESLGAPLRWESDNLLRVEIPPAHRHHFDNRKTLRLAFEHLLWEQGRDLELVAPGSSVLRSLEDALRELGAGTGVVYSGAFSQGTELGEEWEKRMTVVLAKLERTDATPRQNALIRFVYEVKLAGPPPTTELVPIFWDPKRGDILDETRAAELSRAQWYEQAEVASLIGKPAVWPKAEKLKTGENRAERALQRKLAGLMHTASAGRRESITSEKLRLEREFLARHQEVSSPEERQDLAEEHTRRIDVLKEMDSSKAECSLLSRTLLVQGELALALRYVHDRTGAQLTLRPKLRAGKLLYDQCEHCQEPRYDYLIRAPKGGVPALVCTTCGLNCQSSECGSVLLHQTKPVCRYCDAPRFCKEHTEICAVCKRSCCADHGQQPECCARVVCQQHLVIEHGTARKLCVEHAGQCSVDKRWRARSALLTCPVTWKLLAPEHAVSVPGDTRALHPEAVLISPSSGKRVAQDRAVPCSADQALHHPQDMAECAATKELFCSLHLVEVGEPWRMKVAIGRARKHSRTGVMMDESVAKTCSVSGAVLLATEIQKCPVTKLLFDPVLGIELSGRLLHPDGVVLCSVSGKHIARDLAKRDDFNGGGYLHPSAATRCEFSNKTTALSKTHIVSCCNRRVAESLTVASAVSGKLVCPQHRKRCQDHDAWVLPDEAITCEVTGRDSCLEHTRQAACGRRMVLERAPFQLEHGKWGCTDHFAQCAFRGHPAKVSDLKNCATSGKPVCSTHGAECTCHSRRHERSLLREIPYYPRGRYCEAGILNCPNCGIKGPRSGGRVCQYCANKQPLGQSSTQIQGLYKRRVAPVLPWFTVSTSISVSGTTSVALFTVDTMLSGSKRYRAHADGAVYEFISGFWRLL